MTAVTSGLFAVAFLEGVLLCVLCVDIFRSREQPGSVLFAVFLYALGLTVVCTAGYFFAGIEIGNQEATRPAWAQLAVLGWTFASFPWFLFALEYTGTDPDIQTRTLGLIGALYVPGMVSISLVPLGEQYAFFRVVSLSITTLYALGLSMIGSYLIVRTSHKYGHLSLKQGIGLALLPLGTLVSWNMMLSDSTLRNAGLFVLGTTAGIAGVVAVRLRYETFTATPAVGTIGERAIARETDDLVFVVDDKQRVIKLNETAVETLELDRGAIRGNELAETLPEDIHSLENQETVTLQTTDGTRRYDPEVSTVTDQHDRRLGWLLSMRDVTERELREQRLTVLNRVLRHNLRNKIEVIRSHAEVLDPNATNGHQDSILDAADAIVDLGHSARTIDKFLSESHTVGTVDIGHQIDRTLERIDPDTSELTVSVELPENTLLTTSPRALSGALNSAIENAVSYADSTVSISCERVPEGYRIEITDDGPGIPDGELQSIQSGTETALQHGTGLGLWQLKWAVRTMNGDLSFETDQGTTVSIRIPDHENEQGPTPREDRQRE